MTTAQITITHAGKQRNNTGEHIVQVKYYVRHKDEFVRQETLDARTVVLVQKMTAIGLLPGQNVSVMPTLQYVDETPRIEVEVSEDAK